MATGVVEIDNTGGQFMSGQTAYSPIIPRLPVSEVPSEAIASGDDGERKVQVIRDSIVRDVPVQLLGQVGPQHVWVSGRFGPGDELILRTSEPLLDGSVVSMRNAAAKDPQQPAPSPRPTGGPSEPSHAFGAVGSPSTWWWVGRRARPRFAQRSRRFPPAWGWS